MMDHQMKMPKAADADKYAAILAAVLDYTGYLDRVGGNMGMGMNAALSSFVTLMVWNMIYKKKKWGTTDLYHPFMGAISSGILATILGRVLGNNIQNPNLLGAVGTFGGTYIVAYKDDTPASTNY